MIKSGFERPPPFVVLTLAGHGDEGNPIAPRVPAASLGEAARPGTVLDRLLRRYTLYRLRCANQTGACNSMHAAEERMCRWLLMAHDRAGRDEFLITHEFLSELLGIRRQTISIVAGTLQRAGLICYRRGLLRVLDREGLEAASCECYGVMRQLYDPIVGNRKGVEWEGAREPG